MHYAKRIATAAIVLAVSATGASAACLQNEYSFDPGDAETVDVVVERLRGEVTAKGFRAANVPVARPRQNEEVTDVRFMKIEGGRPVAVSCRVIGREGAYLRHTCCYYQD